MALSIKKLANDINKLTDENKWFWSYGLLKDTSKVWEHKNNYALLNEMSQTICDTVFLSIEESKQTQTIQK